MSEQTSNPTSGQNVPKSKFRRKSRQEQTAASKLRMERRGEKLDAAREKLAKQKPPKKPGPVKRLAHTAGHGPSTALCMASFMRSSMKMSARRAHTVPSWRRSPCTARQAQAPQGHPGTPGKGGGACREPAYQGHGGLLLPHDRAQEHPEMQEGGAVYPVSAKADDSQRHTAKQAKEAARQSAAAAEKTATATGNADCPGSGICLQKYIPAGALIAVLCAFLLFGTAIVYVLAW